jgi:hypothetical protein
LVRLAENQTKTLGQLLDVSAARLVVIHDVWTGYSPDSPIAALYDLRRDKRGALVGEGNLSTASVGHRVIRVTVTAVATKRFLGAIARTVVTSGKYEPFVDHTDEYPHVEVALHVGTTGSRAGIALLFTESQGAFNAPWGAWVGGELFTAPGEEIGRALRALRRPLRRQALDKMSA